MRSIERQAKSLVKRKLRLGTPKHGNNDEGYIHSVGTSRNYESALIQFGRWLRRNGEKPHLLASTSELSQAYLVDRSTRVGQKTLDLYRQAIECVLGHHLQKVVSVAQGRRRLAVEARAYTRPQVELVTAVQSTRSAFSTWLALEAGLRAHELLTLGRPEEQPPSSHRRWSPDRFSGRCRGRHYTVQGKGGLAREVMLPKEIAAALELRRLGELRPVVDRRINYLQRYDLIGGNAWSVSFTKASKRALGWSTGAHGLRHAYAQSRLRELQDAGYTWDEARSVVSEELGHFRPEITDVYLR